MKQTFRMSSPASLDAELLKSISPLPPSISNHDHPDYGGVEVARVKFISLPISLYSIRTKFDYSDFIAFLERGTLVSSDNGLIKISRLIDFLNVHFDAHPTATVTGKIVKSASEASQQLTYTDSQIRSYKARYVYCCITDAKLIAVAYMSWRFGIVKDTYETIEQWQAENDFYLWKADLTAESVQAIAEHSFDEVQIRTLFCWLFSGWSPCLSVIKRSSFRRKAYTLAHALKTIESMQNLGNDYYAQVLPRLPENFSNLVGNYYAVGALAVREIH